MTVSRALRTPEQVSDKLREKIEAAVSELGYLPNLAASSLASAPSYNRHGGASLSESGCAEMFAGLQKVLQPAGYHIMLAESQHHLEREEKLLETLLSYNLAAAVLLSVEHSQNARNALIAANIPVVEIGAVRADPIDMSIGIDYVAAVSADANGDRQRLPEHRAAVRQSGTVDLPAAPAGWHKALLRNHMSPHRVINAAQPASFSTGAQQLPEFLLAWPELDALVCASDELAGGALYECQRRRIKVPDNLAVVGFGNSEFSRVCQPPLTTMTIPHRDIGIQAGQALLARLNEQPWLPAGSLPATLCRRDSC